MHPFSGDVAHFSDAKVVEGDDGLDGCGAGEPSLASVKEYREDGAVIYLSLEFW